MMLQQFKPGQLLVLETQGIWQLFISDYTYNQNICGVTFVLKEEALFNMTPYTLGLDDAVWVTDNHKLSNYNEMIDQSRLLQISHHLIDSVFHSGDLE